MSYEWTWTAHGDVIFIQSTWGLAQKNLSLFTTFSLQQNLLPRSFLIRFLFLAAPAQCRVADDFYDNTKLFYFTLNWEFILVIVKAKPRNECEADKDSNFVAFDTRDARRFFSTNFYRLARFQISISNPGKRETLQSQRKNRRIGQLKQKN